jgi:tRNA (uracil-5-)-methyltransferase
MWLKRIIYGLLGVRNSNELNKDLNNFTIKKLVLLFILLNSVFIILIIRHHRILYVIMNKLENSYNLIKTFYSDPVKTNISPASGFRSRCEFGYRNGSYTMVSNGQKIYISKLELAHPVISELMPKLSIKINNSYFLHKKLFQVNFRANNLNKIIVSLIYHKEVNADLFKESSEIAKDLNIEIVLRSKKKILCTSNEILEELINSNNPFYLYQTDQTFFQPNKYMVPRMVNLVESFIKDPKDLLELYCGCGTFSIPLSRIFNKVFATENNRKSMMCLDMAISKNNISNINYSRLSCDEVSEAMTGRLFNRLKGEKLVDYNFSHLLLDPPRSGLTDDVISLVNRFENVIYISCNPETYARDLSKLIDYKISKIEFFDQFVNTNHLEIVSLLQKSK